jgi:PAS domain-containing protein
LIQPVFKTTWIRLLLHFIPLALPVTALAYLIYQERVAAIYSDLASHREILVETRTGIGKTLDLAARDLLSLSKQSGFRLFLEEQDASVGRGLVNDWRTFLAYKKLFDQLRWIDTQGRERIRINYNDGNPVAVDPRNLQDKSNRYYFRESQALRQGAIYLSYFDLNVEHGRIEFPIKPILRLATPVFDRQGQRQGILILNYLGSNLLDQLRHVHGRELWLLNAAGYWMSGPQSELEWGALLGNPQASMPEIYADAWQAMQNTPSGIFEGESGFWMHETIDPAMAIENDVTVVMKDNIRWSLVYHQAIDQYWPLIAKERYLVAGVTAFLLSVMLLVIAGQLRTRDDKESALQRTRVAEAETLAFLQQSPDPLISVGRDGAIVKVNRAALDNLVMTKRPCSVCASKS